MKIDPLFDLTGEVAVVLGGTGGLGGAMAQGLAQAGAKIAILGRNKERGEAKAKELSKHGQAISEWRQGKSSDWLEIAVRYGVFWITLLLCPPKTDSTLRVKWRLFLAGLEVSAGRWHRAWPKPVPRLPF